MSLLEEWVKGSFGKGPKAPPPPPPPPIPNQPPPQDPIVTVQEEMTAIHFPVPQALNLFQGNVAENWRQFKTSWTN